MPTPINTSAVKRFLGLCGYFRDFIPCMSTRTQALQSLLKKGVSFQWTKETAREFQDLKQAVTGPDVMLFHTDWNTPFELHVDASKLGCGAMLAQEKDGVLRPVRFVSQAFTPAESRWTTMHQELFAGKWGLEQFRSYILGWRVKVVTDHANLKWLTTMAPQQAIVAKSCMSMAEFDFFIEHRKGERNVVPDILSSGKIRSSVYRKILEFYSWRIWKPNLNLSFTTTTSSFIWSTINIYSIIWITCCYHSCTFSKAWTSVTSAGERLPLPLDSCCSVSLVSKVHADLVASKWPDLKYCALEEPISVTSVDSKPNLKAVATMDKTTTRLPVAKRIYLIRWKSAAWCAWWVIFRVFDSLKAPLVTALAIVLSAIWSYEHLLSSSLQLNLGNWL